MWILVLILSIFFGIFVFSNIVFPFTYTLPKIKKLRKKDLLREEPSKKLLFLGPSVWAILLFLSVWLVSFYSYATIWIIGLIIGLFRILFKIG